MTLTAADLMDSLTSTPQADSAVEKAVVEANDYDDDYAFDYDPGFSAVDGHGHAGPEHWDRDKLVSVEAINYCTVLDIVVPGYWDMAWDERPDYAECGKRIRQWCEDNDAHYFVWEGASWGRGAMTNEACANAAALGKTKVVIEGLS